MMRQELLSFSAVHGYQLLVCSTLVNLVFKLKLFDLGVFYLGY
jgi:hypothetical protein